jgi:hypothetical protein
MKRRFLLPLLCLLAFAARLPAQGPFPPEAWPPVVNSNAVVHFFSVGEALPPVGETWTPVLRVLSGGDQVTEPFTIGGLDGLKVTGSYLNVADSEFAEWADEEVIDVLMLVYGDGALLNSAGAPRNFNFLTGILPELAAPVGGSLPVEAKNSKWNWVLFRVPNGLRGSDGQRLVGTVPENAQGDFSAGGVNGGTLRLEQVPNLIVRAVAFGPLGAFGEPEVINVFAAPDACDPEPPTNLVFHDVSTGAAHQLELLNNGDQTVTIEDNVGPGDDRRRAARPVGSFMNFGISSNFLGRPCNDPRTMKICITYYDDPALVDVGFGPEAYATDALGGVAFVPAAQREKLRGTGRWQRRSWTIPAVNLFGVNTAPLTGGPRLAFEGGAVAIARVDLGVFRTGTHPLAGQDPLPDCFADPNICTDAYGSFAEMDLAAGKLDGLEPGSSGGDQAMLQAEAGPPGDLRMAIRPAFDDGPAGFTHNYLNFAITGEKLGPTSQPNARLAICVTYYDDPELVGTTFRPEVYFSERNGVLGLAFTPGSIAVPLEGTGVWRDAYFEIPDMKFNGVNQGPQAAARFVLSGKIFFSRVRYAVIRPCGPNAGVNQLEACKPPPEAPMLAITRTGGAVRIAWPASYTDFALRQSATLPAANWEAVGTAPVVEGDQNVVTVQAGPGTLYFQLVR